MTPRDGDPAEGMRAADFGRVRADLAVRQCLAGQRDHHPIDPAQPALPLAHEQRFERPVPVPRGRDSTSPMPVSAVLVRLRLGELPVAAGRIVLNVSRDDG